MARNTNPAYLEAHLIRQLDESRDFFWHRLRWKAVRAHLPRAEAFRLVDVGAGAGLLGEYLRSERPDAVYEFIEPLPSLERGLVARFGAAANRKLDRRWTGTGYVTCLDVLEHQEDDRAFLGDLVARAEPGATIIVTVPAFMLLWSSWDRLLGHHRRYTKRSLLRAIEGLPLDVIEISYLFPEMFPLGIFRKLKRGLGRAQEDAAAPESEFPRLPAWLNAALVVAGSAFLALRRLFPFGTSIMAVLRVRARALPFEP
jgi:hypothetical protein